MTDPTLMPFSESIKDLHRVVDLFKEYYLKNQRENPDH